MLSTFPPRRKKHVVYLVKPVWIDNFFLTDLSKQGITKLPLDLYIKMLPWLLVLVCASVIWLVQPAGECLLIAISYHVWACVDGESWELGGIN